MNVTEWQQRGQRVRVGEDEVFVVDTGETASGKTLLVLHGFPTSSHDYWRVIDKFAASYRVIIHDHLGFGLSDKPVDYSYSLVDQAEVALQLWQQLGVKQAHLLAHDYGTSVATEILARREHGHAPITLDTVTLCNGSIHIELADLRVLQKLLASERFGPLVTKLSRKEIYIPQMRRLWFDRSRFDAADGEAMWELYCRDGGKTRMAQIGRYIHERRRLWHRWIGALTRLDIPCHVLWAKNDPVAVAAIATQVAKETPTAELEWLDHLGHYPMLEDPDRWADAVLAWLAGW